MKEMSQHGQRTTVNEEGKEKQAFQVTFTNGALAELEELAEYFKTDDLAEVLRISIGVVQKIKEQKSQDQS